MPPLNGSGLPARRASRSYSQVRKGLVQALSPALRTGLDEVLALWAGKQGDHHLTVAPFVLERIFPDLTIAFVYRQTYEIG